MSEEKKELIERIKNNEIGSYLDLSYNALYYFSGFNESNNTSLPERNKSFMDALSLNNTITHLNMCSVFTQGVGEVQNITEMLHNNKTIGYLDFSLNDVGNLEYEPIPALIEAFTKHSCLWGLDLSYNSLKDEASSFLFNAMKNNKTIQVLKIQGNEITSQAINILAEALECNANLMHLDLSNNAIGDEGVITLCQVLLDKRNNRQASLNSINLSNNKITDRVVANLFHILEVRATPGKPILDIDLSFNEITDEGTNYLSAALGQNFTTEAFKIYGNKLTASGIENLNDEEMGTRIFENAPLCNKKEIELQRIKELEEEVRGLKEEIMSLKTKKTWSI